MKTARGAALVKRIASMDFAAPVMASSALR